MDIFIILGIVFITGYVRYQFLGAKKQDEDLYEIQSDGTMMNSEGLAPIGSNLEKKKEPDAYTMVLKQFNLR